MKILYLTLLAAFCAGTSAVVPPQYFNYTAQLGPSATKKCALLNVVMDETTSTKDESTWMTEVAIPNIASKLQTVAGGSFDHVFVCGSGFGREGNWKNKSFFRWMGCTKASASGTLNDMTVTDWDNKSKRQEDGWNAMDKAMDYVPPSIDNINIHDECQTFDRTLIMLTDMERREFETNNNPLTLEGLKYDIGCNGYVLNGLVQTKIKSPPGPHWKNFALELHEGGTVNTVHTWDGSDGGWETTTQLGDYNDFVVGYKGTPYDYMPLVIDTPGVLWNTMSLQVGITGKNKQKLMNAFNNHFVEEVVGQLMAGTISTCNAGSGGDPHINTWKKEHFEYHGQCDLVMVKDSEFAEGRGIDVHIRTKIVRFWSYIKTVAIRIGNDVLEIEGSVDADDGEAHYWINYEYQGELDTFAGFPVTQELPSVYKRQYKIDLSSQYPNTHIIVHMYKEFVRVSFNGSGDAFGKTVGILGDYKTGRTLARDGATVLNDFDAFGDEWQVLPSEAKLFREIEEPQFPQKCIHPEDPQGKRRRRLAESNIGVEQAEKACASLKDPLSIKDCVYDILATQDLDIVGAF